LNVPEQRQKEYEAEKLFAEIEQVNATLSGLTNEAIIIKDKDIEKLEKELRSIKTLLENGKGDYNTKTQAMERLRDVLKKIDRIQEDNKWPTIEHELLWLVQRMNSNQQRYGSDKTKKQLVQFEEMSSIVISQKNIKAAIDLMEEIRSFNFSLVRDDIGYWIKYIKEFDDNFSTHQWKNITRARILINEAKQIILSNPSKIKIEEIVWELFSLLPEKEKVSILENDDSTLMR